MARLILKTDHLPALRERKKRAVNENFAAMVNTHVDQIHALKKQWATSDLDKLQPEAELRGITKEELAAIILAKPDPIAERELQRQKIMLAIDAATSAAEIEAV